MSDTTITPEERARMRQCLHLLPEPGPEVALRLLDALEAAEAQRDKALQMNAERQAAITETALNALLAGITGEKKSVGLNVSGYNCPYCGEISKTVEDATAHDATCPKHPAVVRAAKAEADLSRVKGAGIEALRRAEQAEAENARLRVALDWFREREVKVFDFAAPCQCEDEYFEGEEFAPCGENADGACPRYNHRGCGACWVEHAEREAARRAVAGEGEPSC